MNLDRIYKRAARLLADAKEQQEAQQEASEQVVVFYYPDIEGEPIDPDAPPIDEKTGMRPYRVYLPMKKQLT